MYISSPRPRGGCNKLYSAKETRLSIHEILNYPVLLLLYPFIKNLLDNS